MLELAILVKVSTGKSSIHVKVDDHLCSALYSVKMKLDQGKFYINAYV